MAKISEVEIPALLFDEQGSAPSTPASSLWKVYFKSDGLYIVDDAGTESGPLGAASAPALVGARLRKSTSTAVNATTVLVQFDTEDLDTDGFHEGVTNPSRLTIPSDLGGVYMVGGSAAWDGGGDRTILTIRKNGNSSLDIVSQELTGTASGHTPRIAVASITTLADADYLELAVFNTGNRNVPAVAAYSPVLWAYRIGDAPA